MDCHAAKFQLHWNLDNDIPADNFTTLYEQQQNNPALLTQLQEYAHQWWEKSYDHEECFGLQEAIIEQEKNEYVWGKQYKKTVNRLYSFSLRLAKLLISTLLNNFTMFYNFNPIILQSQFILI